MGRGGKDESDARDGSASGASRDAETDPTVAAAPDSKSESPPPAAAGSVSDSDLASDATVAAPSSEELASDATVAATGSPASPLTRRDSPRARARRDDKLADRDAETRSIIIPANREAETQPLGEAATIAGAYDDDGDGIANVAPPPRTGVSLRRGDRLEQFLILDELGAGGMGVVVAAHDPDLDRKVAIKVLRTERFAEDTESAGRLRLLREAQAMAKLSHPNVITVHEVGTVDDQVFVAMEFVDGTTLDGWVDKAGGDWRLIVDKFIAAGRGLAAAHEAGLVHRDFKPANVLVGKDGQVKVTDFGLVGAIGAGAEIEANASDSPLEALSGSSSGLMSSAGGTPLAITLTCAGQILGTPVYMAPEQHMGQKVDARADQFAFCVALYEALVGKRPFSRGHGYQDLATNVTRGKVRPIPREAGVPGWLQKLIMRGLEVDPDARFASMDELLAALEKDPAVARRRAVGIGAVAVLAVLAGFGLLRGGGGGSSGPDCDTGQAKLAGVWDEQVKLAVRDKFVATKLAYAEDTYDRVATAMDDYAASWVAMRKDACEATHVRGEQSGPLLDARMHCLDRRLGAVGALTRLYAKEVDAGALNKAVQAVLDLAPLDSCGDAKALMAAVPLPDDPGVRKAVAGLRARLDDVAALHKAGKSEDGIVMAEKVVAEAREVGYPLVLAEALESLGELERVTGKPKRAEKSLREAAEVAATVGDDEIIARSWARLVYVIGYQQAKHDAAIAAGEFARVAVARAGGDDRLAGLLDNNLGSVLMALGKNDDAKAHYQLAVESLIRGYGAESPNVAKSIFNLGILMKRLGDLEQSERLYDHARSIFESSYGARHPKVAQSLGGLTMVLLARGDLDKAHATATRVLDIHTATLGADDPRLAASLATMAMVLMEMNRLEDAEQYAKRSYDVWTQALGGDHPNVANPLAYLGTVYRLQGRLDEARSMFEQVLAIRRNALGEAHPDVARSLFDLGMLAVEEKDWKRARLLCGESLMIEEKFHGSATVETSYSLVCIGRAWFGAGESGKAVKTFEKVLKIRVEGGVGPGEVGEARRLLALSLWSSQPQRAVELAKKARSDFVKAGSKEELAAVDEWLHQRKSD